MIKKVLLLSSICLAGGQLSCSKPKPPEPALPASGSAAAPAATAPNADFAGKTPEQALDHVIALSLDTVYFDFDSSLITADAQSHLKVMAKALNADPKLSLGIEGHADARGSNEYNLALSQKRSESIRDFLKSEGVNESRLMLKGMGEEQPAIEGVTEAAYSKNRRAEFRKVVN
jgi:peptidoglycan-associated lipoprotein